MLTQMTCCEQLSSESPQRYKCEKHHLEISDIYLNCKDPELYCKSRSARMIHNTEKKRKEERCQAADA